MSAKTGKNRKRASAPDAQSDAPGKPPVLDPRMMLEKQMNNLGKLIKEKDFASIEEVQDYLDNMLKQGEPIPDVEPETPLERAQDLIYQAYQETSPKRRADMARRAVEISPDCADAYNILAETERSPEKALALYEQGMAAGERAIGTEGFHEMEGNFWSATETRPYMRASQNVAELAWMLGQRRRAIEIFEHMLRLNPNDNQGVRYRLISYYLEEGDDKAAIKLLKKYKDDAAATWAYSQALVIFRLKGPGPDADKAFNIAFKANPHVPAYLLGKKHMPLQLPDHIGLGDTSEAVDYVASGRHAWNQTPGALDWLAQHDTAAQARKPSDAK
jgi:tetratricopeptide (TPR) repeat protein